MTPVERDRTDLGLIPAPGADASHTCDGGWLPAGENAVRPCPACRPHLIRATDRHSGLTAWRTRSTSTKASA